MSTVYTEIRLLLNLWDMGTRQATVKKSELLRCSRKGEKEAYKELLQQLVDEGAIALTTEKVVKAELTDMGQQKLTGGLLADGSVFDGQLVGSRLANAGLRWFRQYQAQAPSQSENVVEAEAIAPEIATYDEFKAVALETYDRLNRDYNLSNLVPIYQIRREIGDRVTRSQFNDWMLELQSKDVLQLITGLVTDLTPDKEKDSITTELGGLRYYAKLL
jgi:hypothetical protein